MSYPHSKHLITLYNSTVCPFAQRAAWGLKEAGVEHHTEYIDLLNKPGWLATVNPASKVPAVRLLDGTILLESLPITRYIADKYPAANLVPADALDKYKVNLFIDTYAGNIISFAFQLIKSNEADRKAKVNEIAAYLRQINDFLLENSPTGPYLLGKTLSIAEISSISFIERLQVVFKVLNIDFDNFEGLDRFYQWKNAAMSRPAYVATVGPFEEKVAFFKSLIPK